MKRYIVCITKHPYHSDPHTMIQYLGTSDSSSATKAEKKWTVPQVVAAIESGTDAFYCRDKRGDQVKVIVAKHNGHKYVKTENDGIYPDNLLAKRECNW